MDELIEQFCDQENLHSFEGDSGLDKFEKVIEALGYRPHGFKHGDLISVFLSDNPGAVEALMNWIKEQNCDEWMESIESYLQEEE